MGATWHAGFCSKAERPDLQPLCDDLLLGQNLEGIVLLGVLDQHDLSKCALAQHLDLLKVCQPHFLHAQSGLSLHYHIFMQLEGIKAPRGAGILCFCDDFLGQVK